MTDLLTRLTEARPTDTELDDLWSPADRAAMLHRLTARPVRHRPRRRTTLLVAAAAAAVTVVVVPSLDSGDAAAAADLHALARSAVAHDGPVLTDGGWLHVRGTSVQRNSPGYQGGSTYAHDRESWTSFDGRTTYVIDREDGHPADYDTFAAASPASYQEPTPAFAASLPDTADGLLAYLDPLVLGSSSHTEAMYAALVQLAGSHTLPPATLAAAFDALATLDHVTTDDVDVEGRPAVEVTYDEELTSSTEGYVFDRATGQELSTHDHSEQSDYVSTTALSEAVDRVPADVLERFRTRSEPTAP